jgi:flagellar hook assembly protein FlgD
VSIKVYNAMGQLVRTLENRRLEPGRYSVTWNAMNSGERKVSSGVYFYRMEASGFSATRKLVIVE